jgi:hypothetical protein
MLMFRTVVVPLAGMAFFEKAIPAVVVADRSRSGPRCRTTPGGTGSSPESSALTGNTTEPPRGEGAIFRPVLPG